MCGFRLSRGCFKFDCFAACKLAGGCCWVGFGVSVVTPF